MEEQLNCDSKCGSCAVSSCGSRSEEQHDFCAKLHPYSKVKHVIGIVSGKGGVGKSLITSLLASETHRRGLRAAILDGDITGPSIPQIFNTVEKAEGTQTSIFPISSKGGIQTISINNLLEDDRQPVVWRGPIVADVVKQFWSNVIWEDVDYMFVDMPPGTGDVPLTVFQSLPLDGIVIVTSPQQLVSQVVSKAVNMANMMNISILGVVENMSYLECDNCQNKMELYGPSHLAELTDTFALDALARVPIQPKLAALCDAGEIETYEGVWLKEAVDTILRKIEARIAE